MKEFVSVIIIMSVVVILVKSAPLNVSSCEEILSRNVAYINLRKEVNEERCTGFRYQKSHVITAAHCVFDHKTILNESKISMVFHNLMNGAFRTKVKNVFLHEKYQPEFYNNDLAEMIVNSTFPFSSNTKCSFRDEEKVYMLGFMVCSDPENLDDVSIQPLIKEGKIIDSENCSDPRLKDTESVICVEPVGDNIPCSGDSGGPVFNNSGILIGVISGVVNGLIVVTPTPTVAASVDYSTILFYVSLFCIFVIVLIVLPDLIFYLFKRMHSPENTDDFETETEDAQKSDEHENFVPKYQKVKDAMAGIYEKVTLKK